MRQVRRCVTKDVAMPLVLTVIMSRLDYCNSTLAGLRQSTLQPLQRAQNAAARLICVDPRHSFTHWTAFMIMGLDRTYHAHQFVVFHLKFLFIPCGRLSWLPVSFLLQVKYTLSYRIVPSTSHHVCASCTGCHFGPR